MADWNQLSLSARLKPGTQLTAYLAPAKKASGTRLAKAGKTGKGSKAKPVKLAQAAKASPKRAENEGLIRPGPGEAQTKNSATDRPTPRLQTALRA